MSFLELKIEGIDWQISQVSKGKWQAIAERYDFEPIYNSSKQQLINSIKLIANIYTNEKFRSIRSSPENAQCFRENLDIKSNRTKRQSSRKKCGTTSKMETSSISSRYSQLRKSKAGKDFKLSEDCDFDIDRIEREITETITRSDERLSRIERRVEKSKTRERAIKATITEITKNIEDLETTHRQLQDAASAIGKEIEQCSNNIGGLAATAYTIGVWQGQHSQRHDTRLTVEPETIDIQTDET
ncbi:MAG: hypothetical protein ACRC2V_13555 [Xenococcaceae cyanobacterium]